MGLRGKAVPRETHKHPLFLGRAPSGVHSQPGWPQLSKAQLVRATSAGAKTPADGVSERLGWGKAKILNVFFFPKVLEFPWSSHGRCLPSRDLSWYERRIPFSWTWRLAWNSRRSLTEMWGRVVNSGLESEFRSVICAGLSH